MFAYKTYQVDGVKYIISGKPIAEGATATIYCCKLKSNKRSLFALKKIVANDDESENATKEEIRTLVTLSGGSHPNIVNLIAYEQQSERQKKTGATNNIFLLLYPFFRKGTLADVNVIHEGIFLQILDALDFMHKSGYRHNDVKPLNVLLSDDEKTPILTDLGSATPATVTVSSRKEALTIMDFHARNTTASYRAPELWDIPSKTTITAKADAFSAGAVLFFILFKKPCFEYHVGKVLLPTDAQYESDDFLVNVLLSLLIVESENRMSIGEAIDALKKSSLSPRQAAINDAYYKSNITMERKDTSILSSDFADFSNVSFDDDA